MLFSIIIPMYNAAAFIGKCLESCINQDSSWDYEIIVVNDGSIDEGPIIVEEYIGKYPKIRMITQSNGGLSSARNTGMNSARGKYVWFVDADDWIAQNSLSLLSCATVSNPDVIPIRAMLESNGRIRNKIPTSCRTGTDILVTKHWEHCAPFYVFKQSFLIQFSLSFFVGIYHEDSEFTPRALYYAKTVTVIPEVLYYIYANVNSITRSLNAKKSYDNIVVCESLFRFNNEIVTDQTIKHRLCDTISMLINNALANIVLFDEQERHRFDSYLYNKRIVLKCLRYSSLKYRVESVLFRLFPKHYVRLYSLLKTLDNNR